MRLALQCNTSYARCYVAFQDKRSTAPKGAKDGSQGSFASEVFSHKEAQKAQKDFIDFCAFCASLWQMISFFVAESVRGRHSVHLSQFRPVARRYQ